MLARALCGKAVENARTIGRSTGLACAAFRVVTAIPGPAARRARENGRRELHAERGPEPLLRPSPPPSHPPEGKTTTFARQGTLARTRSLSRRRFRVPGSGIRFRYPVPVPVPVSGSGHRFRSPVPVPVPVTGLLTPGGAHRARTSGGWRARCIRRARRRRRCGVARESRRGRALGSW